MEFDATHPRQAHVQYETVRLARTVRFRNSSAEANTLTSMRTDRISLSSDLRTETSSSTTETRGAKWLPLLE